MKHPRNTWGKKAAVNAAPEPSAGARNVFIRMQRTFRVFRLKNARDDMNNSSRRNTYKKQAEIKKSEKHNETPESNTGARVVAVLLLVWSQ